MSKTILIIEDNATILEMYRYLFEGFDWHILYAANAPEALAIWEDLTLDLILTDLGLPGISGIQASQILRERERQSNRPRTPIIGTSAQANKDLREKCLLAGMDDFLPRPVPLDQLVEKMRTHLQETEAA